jgi:pyruvate/2-oxoglutarate dehydrogenase complex dihydrolipoamide dehydrogenase (E3) component
VSRPAAFASICSESVSASATSSIVVGEDADVAEEVLAILKQDGIEVMLKARAERVVKSGGGIQLTVRAGQEPQMVQGSHLLTATGRTPNTDSLNVGAAAGIATNERGFIKVNSKLETNVEGIYALGDINGGPAFTHISYDDFRILRTNLIEKGKRHDRESLRSLHALHRSAAWARGHHGRAGARAKQENSRRQNAHDLRGPRARSR